MNIYFLEFISFPKSNDNLRRYSFRAISELWNLDDNVWRRCSITVILFLCFLCAPVWIWIFHFQYFFFVVDLFNWYAYISSTNKGSPLLLDITSIKVIIWRHYNLLCTDTKWIYVNITYFYIHIWCIGQQGIQRIVQTKNWWSIMYSSLFL